MPGGPVQGLQGLLQPVFLSRGSVEQNGVGSFGPGQGSGKQGLQGFGGFPGGDVFQRMHRQTAVQGVHPFRPGHPQGISFQVPAEPLAAGDGFQRLGQGHLMELQGQGAGGRLVQDQAPAGQLGNALEHGTGGGIFHGKGNGIFQRSGQNPFDRCKKAENTETNDRKSFHGHTSPIRI